MEAFETLWAECSEPSDRDDCERRELAELFWRAGEKAQRARIRQMALDEARRLEAHAPFPTEYGDHVGVAVQALRDFAALLEEKP